jgi:hypothetical protein
VFLSTAAVSHQHRWLLGATLTAFAIVVQTWTMGRAVFLLDVALAIAFVFWVMQSAVAPASRVLPALIVSLLVQVAHFSEEFRTGFQTEFPSRFGYTWGDARFFAFNVAWLVVFGASAVAVARGRRLGYLAAYFLAIGGGIGNGLGHLALAAGVGGYYPGGYTATLALAAGVFLLVRLRPSPAPADRVR